MTLPVQKTLPFPLAPNGDKDLKQVATFVVVAITTGKVFEQTLTPFHTNEINDELFFFKLYQQKGKRVVDTYVRQRLLTLSKLALSQQQLLVYANLHGFTFKQVSQGLISGFETLKTKIADLPDAPQKLDSYDVIRMVVHAAIGGYRTFKTKRPYDYGIGDNAGQTQIWLQVRRETAFIKRFAQTGRRTLIEYVASMCNGCAQQGINPAVPTNYIMEYARLHGYAAHEHKDQGVRTYTLMRLLDFSKAKKL